MPTNTYGPGDNYNLKNSHFIPAIIKKIHEVKKKQDNKIYLWGDGQAKREIIFVDDLADAIIFFLNKKTKEYLINIGSGVEKTIYQYAKLISKILGVKISISYVNKNLKGTPRKLLNLSISRKYRWKARIKIKEGIKKTYESYLKSIKK
jgi:GDP-L-fucose synthase